MSGLIDIVMLALVLTNLVQLGSSRLAVGIKAAAAQGFFLGALPFLCSDGSPQVHVVVLALCAIILRGVIFPKLLLWALHEADIRREPAPYVGYTASLMTGVLALAAALWLSANLPLPEAARSPLMAPVSLFSLLIGLFIIISRRTALNQVVGYLVIENGIYVFGLLCAGELPWLLELGTLLDALLAVLIMGIGVFHLSREFDHIDADRLRTLKG